MKAVITESIQEIFDWIVQYENGGFLNVVFKPEKTDAGTTFDLEIDQSTLIDYAKSIAFGIGAMPLKVLAAMPEMLGGGEEGVRMAEATPNREKYFIAVPIFCTVLMILGVLGIFVINFTCCLCCKNWRCCKLKKIDEKSNNVGKKNKNKPPVLSALNKKAKVIRKTEQNKLCCGLHIVTVIFTIIYVIGLLVSIGFYFPAGKSVSDALNTYTEEEVEQWIKRTTDDFSILQIADYLLRTTFRFLHNGVEGAAKGTTGAIAAIDNDLPDTLNTTMMRLIEGVLEALLLDELEKQNQNAGSFTKIQKSSTINVNMMIDSTMSTITELQLLESKFEKECVDDCLQSVIADPFDFVIPLRFMPIINKFVISSLSEIETILQNFGTSINSTRETVHNMESQISEEISAKLKISEYIEPIQDVWKELETKISEIEKELTPTFDSYKKTLAIYSPYILPAIYVPAVIFLIIAIVVLVCLVIFIIEAVKNHLFSVDSNKAIEEARKQPNRKSTHVCGSFRFFLFSIFMFIAILIFALVATLILVLASIFAGEVCPYVSELEGLSKTDFVLDGFLTKRWPDIEVSLIPPDASSSLPNGTLNIKQPRNVLNSIAVKCDPINEPEKGLLYQIGLTDLVNITAVLESEPIKEGLVTAETYLMDSISGANLKDKIPDMEGPLNSAISIIQKRLYIDEYRAAESLLEKMDDYIEKMRQVEEDLTNIGDPKLEKLISDCGAARVNMIAARPYFDQLMEAYGAISDDYSPLFAISPIVERFRDIVDSKNSISNAISPVFDPTITGLLQTIGDSSQKTLTSLTDGIFPCEDLNAVGQAFARMSCSEAGIIPRLFAWGLFLSLVGLFSFLSFVSLFFLWFFQTHQSKRFSKNLDKIYI